MTSFRNGGGRLSQIDRIRVLTNCHPRPLREREEFQHEERVLEIRVRGGA